MKNAAMALLLILMLSTLGIAGEWTGYIADANCAATKGEDPGHAACAKSCIGRGADAVFVTEGKVFKLDKQDDAKKFAGEKVLLKGVASEDGKSIKVETISKAE